MTQETREKLYWYVYEGSQGRATLNMDGTIPRAEKLDGLQDKELGCLLSASCLPEEFL